jgi:hypothetical protein
MYYYRVPHIVKSDVHTFRTHDKDDILYVMLSGPFVPQYETIKQNKYQTWCGIQKSTDIDLTVYISIKKVRGERTILVRGNRALLLAFVIRYLFSD